VHDESTVLCACGCGLAAKPGRTYLHNHHFRVIPPRPLAERFWRLVDKTGDCWLWIGARRGSTRNQYGCFWGGRERGYLYAHRVAYELQHGPIPVGLSVLHLCDTPLCVRGTHLDVGTVTENNRQMRERDRQAAGERHGSAFLTVEQVRAIRQRYAQGGVSLTTIAVDMCVSFSLIHAIVRRKIWKHIE
jgi:hypothetical protein